VHSLSPGSPPNVPARQLAHVSLLTAPDVVRTVNRLTNRHAAHTKRIEAQRAVPLCSLGPLTGAALEGLSEEEHESELGERIYSILQHLDDHRADKLTGMLLEMKDSELLKPLCAPDAAAAAAAFAALVEEAREEPLEAHDGAAAARVEAFWAAAGAMAGGAAAGEAAGEASESDC